ncbi:hypothetical protein D9758_004971 [Tetrapyrgos nigripes]|uniref:Uncharacterized protein n=1 Tax=Tetrapyrgos nigripes TaxID=182062 RepID=A0A8H5GW05_9AGAR|nr:hypothetical protein D9758_004971 [Tetrapyrgos nigripes]
MRKRTPWGSSTGSIVFTRVLYVLTSVLLPTLTVRSLNVDTLPSEVALGEDITVTWHRTTTAHADPTQWEIEFVQDDNPLPDSVFIVPAQAAGDGTVEVTIPTSVPDSGKPLQLVAFLPERNAIFSTLAQFSIQGGQSSSQGDPDKGMSSQDTTPTTQTSQSIRQSQASDQVAGPLTSTPTSTLTTGSKASVSTNPSTSDSISQTTNTASSNSSSSSDHEDASGAPSVFGSTDTPSLHGTTPGSSSSTSFNSHTTDTSSSNLPFNGGSSGASAHESRLAIILPSVIGALVLLLVIIGIFWRCRRRRTQRSTRKISAPTDSSNGSNTSSDTFHPYDLKPEFPINPPDRLHEPFPGEAESTCTDNSNIIPLTRRILRGWHGTRDCSTQPHPYQLKQEEPTVNTATQPLTDNHRASNNGDSSLSYPSTNVRPRSLSESSIARSPIQGEVDLIPAGRSVFARDRDTEVHDEMRQMREHIQRLEMLVTSNGTRGLTDEPPPMYHA